MSLSVNRALTVVGGTALFALSACGDAVQPCPFGDASAQVAGVASDWREEIDRLVASAPADSALEIVVFVPRAGKEEVREWASTHGATIRYEFTGFSGFVVQTVVRELLSLRAVQSVTGIDWNTVVYVGSAGCQ